MIVCSLNMLDKDELLIVANQKHDLLKETIEESERYGHGYIFRKYGLYPNFLPLRVVISHGPSQWDFVTPHVFNYKNIAVGFYSQRFVDQLREKGTFKKVFKIISPFAYYRQSNNILPSKNAKGSLFFYAHSTFWTDIDTSFEELLSKFKEMPFEFQPIEICMHFVDIQKGLHEKFLKLGYKVHSAGHWENKYFIKNFYKIITNYKYTFSNMIGSYTFYSVECGIPFSLIDLKVSISNNTDENIIKSGMSLFDHKQHIKCIQLFSGIHNVISSQQKELVNEELGIIGSISRIECAYFLYLGYIELMSKKIKNRLTAVVKKVTGIK